MVTAQPSSEPVATAAGMAVLQLVKVARVAQRRFAEALKPTGLTSRHLQVLGSLRPGPLGQQALAETVAIDPNKLVGLLNELETQRLIRRRRDADDRRRHTVAILPAGERRLAGALATAEAIEGEILAALDQEQRAELQSLLGLVAQGLLATAPCVQPEDADDPLDAC